MPELAFFVGKGGVGKTTISSSYAVHCARQKPAERVILISTDPAHSLADVLQKKLTGKLASVAVSRRSRLHVWQVDSVGLFRSFMSKYREQIVSVMDAGAIFSREDIEPLIDSALPGMAEMSALLAIHETVKSERYDRIIIDTAPFGHTLRLFQLPSHFARFVNFLDLAASRDRVLAAHFGGSAKPPVNRFLREWQSLAQALRRAFGKAAELFLVTTSENLSLNESVRSAALMSKDSHGAVIRNVVLNRATVRADGCAKCHAKKDATQGARRFLARVFPNAQHFVAEDSGSPVLGIESLANFGEHVFSGKKFRARPSPVKKSAIRFRSVDWPDLDSPLSFVLGKGGVGKTTMSAALALKTRTRVRAAVDICSVDPAPSLEDIFGRELGDVPIPVLGDGKLRACAMDAPIIFRRWVQEIRANIEEATSAQVSGIQVDFSFERQLLSALLEIVPPGVDEVMAVFRIVDLLSLSNHRVIVDMAPTGHALELLRMPERIVAWSRLLLKTLAAHRTLALAQDAAVKIAEMGQRARELVKMLGSSSATGLYVVMLAEPLPDRETERLTHELQQIGIGPEAVFVNRVLFAEDVGKCRRCRRAMAWQHATLARLKKRYSANKLYIVRNRSEEVVGRIGLRSLTGELWQLA